jgi:hypothetical protein
MNTGRPLSGDPPRSAAATARRTRSRRLVELGAPRVRADISDSTQTTADPARDITNRLM